MGALAGHAGVVGVDIGSETIKIVELSSSGPANVKRTLALGSVPTPVGTVDDGRITDVEAVGRALRDLTQSAGVQSRHSVAAINGQAALIREVVIPPLPPPKVREATRFEVERYLPYPISDVTFDSAVVGETRYNDARKMNLLVVAARTDVLRQHAAALETAGLEPVALEVEPLAAARSVASYSDARRVTACIHLGSKLTMILIAEGSVPRVIRTVSFGTKLLKEIPANNHDAIADNLSSLVIEIRRSLEYYGGRYQAVAPDRVVLTGGGAMLPGITTALTSAIDVPVEIADPFADLGGQSQRVSANAAAVYAIAAGLARRGDAKTMVRINLLPGRHRQFTLGPATVVGRIFGTFLRSVRR